MTVQLIPAKFFVVDQTADSNFRYGASGAYIGSNVLHSANTTSRGVATDTNAALTHTGTKTASRSFALNKSNTNPQDLVTDGTTVWVTQVDTLDKVFVYRASNGLLPWSWNIDSANGSPVGITIDPTKTTGSLWIVDDVTKRNARSWRGYVLNEDNAVGCDFEEPV